MSQKPKGIAARAGRWSAAHRKTAIFGWLAFVIIAFSLSIFSPMTTIDPTDSGVGESGRADKIIDRSFDLTRTAPARSSSSSPTPSPPTRPSSGAR